MPSWKKVIISGSDAALNSLNVTNSLTASGIIYPTTDGTSGQVVITDGNGNLSFSNVENTTITVKNMSGATITKGTPCYITGSGTSGNLAGIWPADASNPLRMPAGVIAGESLTAGAEGVGLINGFISGVNTSAFNAGDSVYVAVGGGYTNVRPTGSSVLIQKLGNVEKSHASNGSGVINGPGYYNEVPNIQQGYTWVGNSNGVAVAVATSSIQNVVSSSFASTSSFLNSNTNAFVQSGNSFGTTALLGTNDNQSLALETNGTTRMFISSSGNVGIGTTTPSVDLEVASKDATTTVARIRLTNKDVSVVDEQDLSEIQFYNSDADGAHVSAYIKNIAAETFGRKGQLAFGVSTTNSTNAVEAFRIDENANVGIGTTTPAYKLGVNGTFGTPVLWTTAGGITQWGSTGTAYGTLTWDTGYARIHATSGNRLDLGAGGGLHMTIATSGNVGIGTTVPGDLFTVNGNIRIVVPTDAGLYGYDAATNGSKIYSISRGTNLSVNDLNINSYNGFGIKVNASTLVKSGHNFYINSTGNVGIGTTSPAGLLHLKSDFSSGVAVIYDRTQNSNVDSLFYTGVSTNGATTSDFMWMGTSTSDMTITGAGNVGIGTTAPGAKLDVEGDVLIKAANLSNQENTDVDTGTEVVAIVAIATYTAAFFDFVIKNGTNVRSGTVFACHDGTNVEYTETSTADLGTTSPLTLSVDISSGNMRLLATATTDNWSVKTLVRAL